ncbi:MAG: hypothetical protein GY913_05355 [Proteobacteria bacterium]|nr:hypothetical protein [Pseudomonadota bacterium]
MLSLLLWLWFAIAPASAAEWSTPDRIDPLLELEAPPAPPMRFVSLPGIYADVHGRPQDKAVMERLAAHAAESVPRIADQLGIGAGRTINLYLADDEAAFDQLQPGTPPNWADGTAWPQRGLIYLKSPRIRSGTSKPLEQVLDHEITHVLLGQAFGTRPVPRWLQEGLAQWVAGEIGPDLPKRLADGAWRNGGLHDLEELTRGFPRDPAEADLAYAESADLIAFVATEYGPEAIPTLVQEMASGRPVNAAFYAATGDLAVDVDQAWRARLSVGFLSLAPLGDGMLWLGAGAPFVLFAFLRVRARNRETMARWAEEDEQEARALRDLMRRWPI